MNYNESLNMGNLITLNNVEDDKILKELFENEIIVFEDVQGSKIWVNYDGDKFNIKPKSLSNDPINLVDLTMQKYYNKAINYFNGLNKSVKSLLNKKWWFCFEYFPDNEPANIKYSRIPKNNLVLTTINKGKKKYESNIEELREYARLLDVDVIPIIYQGKLSEKMIEAIKYFLNTSENDLEYIFNEKSFAFFFYKLLNPTINNSFLMNEGEFQNNLEKLIIKVKDKNISFEILNPLYKKISDTNSTDYADTYSFIITDFLIFCQSINLSDIKLKGNKKEEIYIYLICKLFNKYVMEVKNDLINLDITIPTFFNKDKFKINTELIPNKLTKKYIENDPKLEYIFKIILSSFNKKRKKPIGILSEKTLLLFNNFVDKILKFIDLYLNKLDELDLKKTNLIRFSDHFKIEYDKDGEGKVYPRNVQKTEVDEKEKTKGKKIEGKYVIPYKYKK